VRRPSSPLTAVGSALAGVGFVLLVLEVARTLNGQALGGLGSSLLWVGFGLLSVGLIVLVVSLLPETAPGPQPAAAPATAPTETDEPSVSA
jgi:hypothetical protein